MKGVLSVPLIPLLNQLYNGSAETATPIGFYLYKSAETGAVP